MSRASHPPDTPTQAQPGSEEKILVLSARAARREPLFHAGDYADCFVNNNPSRRGRPRKGTVGTHGGKWFARIMTHGRRRWLGLHATREAAEQAIEAYLKKDEEDA